MALLFTDGMDNWSSPSNVSTGIYTLYLNANQGNITQNNTAGRFGQGALVAKGGWATSHWSYLLKNFGVSYGTMILSMAFFANQASSYYAGNAACWCGTYDSTSGSWQTSVGISNQLAPFARQGNAPSSTNFGTLLGTGTPGSLSNSVWHWVSIKIVFATSATGSVTVSVDGVTSLNLTGVQTASTNASADSFWLGYSLANVDISVATFYLDDVVVCDNSGGAPLNDTLADRRIYTQVPASSGVNSLWTPLSGTGYSQVSELPGEDGDTTYIYDGTVGQISDFGHGSLSGVNAPDAVTLKTYARKDDANSRNVIPLVLLSGVEKDGATHSLATSYQGYMDIMTTDPNSAAWTLANWNAATAGVKTA